MKSWISSPLVCNYVLSLYKNGTPFQKKYLQIYNILKERKDFSLTNKVFVSQSWDVEKLYKTSGLEVEKVEFNDSKHATQSIIEWIKQHCSWTDGVDILKYVVPATTALLINVSEFKGTWQSNEKSAVMKVHNSFTYTEDIKYDARLLELPMHNEDIKLVLIVPNEPSSIGTLFHKLANGGLDAAVSCVQPLFTFSTVLEAPSIDYSAKRKVTLSENNCDIYNGLQLGNVQINENGTNISIITCLGLTYKSLAAEEKSETELPFYFAVLYKDTAIFTGCYVKD